MALKFLIHYTKNVKESNSQSLQGLFVECVEMAKTLSRKAKQ